MKPNPLAYLPLCAGLLWLTYCLWSIPELREGAIYTGGLFVLIFFWMEVTRPKSQQQ